MFSYITLILLLPTCIGHYFSQFNEPSAITLLIALIVADYYYAIKSIESKNKNSPSMMGDDPEMGEKKPMKNQQLLVCGAIFIFFLSATLSLRENSGVFGLTGFWVAWFLCYRVPLLHNSSSKK